MDLEQSNGEAHDVYGNYFIVNFKFSFLQNVVSDLFILQNAVSDLFILLNFINANNDGLLMDESHCFKRQHLDA
jgi:hypothetical protein